MTITLARDFVRKVRLAGSDELGIIIDSDALRLITLESVQIGNGETRTLLHDGSVLISDCDSIRVAKEHE
ncbi:hypothetical protein [Endozoicomonas sp.]|uniref:hypothetical protein n=1 Tax=Endozoicomonas sp. TaxID=1892382 RepID=UPI00383AF69F